MQDKVCGNFRCSQSVEFFCTNSSRNFDEKLLGDTYLEMCEGCPEYTCKGCYLEMTGRCIDGKILVDKEKPETDDCAPF